jgi:hypothetical protein
MSVMLVIKNEEADRFVPETAIEVYNCITTPIISQPENERNKAGRSAQFSLNFQKDIN